MNEENDDFEEDDDFEADFENAVLVVHNTPLDLGIITMPTEAARDPSLTLKEKGIFAVLLSFGDNTFIDTYDVMKLINSDSANPDKIAGQEITDTVCKLSAKGYYRIE